MNVSPFSLAEGVLRACCLLWDGWPVSVSWNPATSAGSGLPLFANLGSSYKAWSAR